MVSSHLYKTYPCLCVWTAWLHFQMKVWGQANLKQTNIWIPCIQRRKINVWISERTFISREGQCWHKCLITKTRQRSCWILKKLVLIAKIGNAHKHNGLQELTLGICCDCGCYVGVCMLFAIPWCSTSILVNKPNVAWNKPKSQKPPVITLPKKALPLALFTTWGSEECATAYTPIVG